MSKISFVMPTKNRGTLIGESIKSIIDQTLTDWELIIVDDHSDSLDETENVVKKFQDSRIKYIKMPNSWPGGIAAARNFGNMFATSPIIAVADSDDLSRKNRAELTVKAFAEEKCDVFYGHVEIYNQAKDELHIRAGKYPVIKFSLEKMKEYDLIPHGSSAYKTEIARNFPYNSFYQNAEDYDFFTRLAVDGKKFYFCDEIIYRYLVHENNTSSKIPGRFGKLAQSDRGWIEVDRGQILEDIING